jgi:hypothetical protein
VLAGLALAAPAGASGGPAGSYDVTVLPDPSQQVSPYGGCRPSSGAYAAGQELGVDARQISLPGRGTLRAELVEQADVFAGDVGLRWSLRVFDTAGRELARSGGPAWRTDVTMRTAQARRVWLVACNTNGHPQARVSYAFR